MLKCVNQFLFCLGVIFVLSGCTPKDVTLQEKKSQPVGSISETARDQGGQIPEKIAVQASESHGGSMIASKVANGGDKTEPQTMGPEGITMILGPINAERLVNNKGVSVDAGQSIRETISQKLTGSKEISLFDAPEERFIDDSPRPDLSRRGVKFVVKGVASTGSDSNETTVFLRAVDTMTGKVAMVASARHESQNQAAEEAAQRLLTKITGGK
ncbi:hypothetical protein [Desulfospira joergensenii]|uniref:hypothetical protein n=1 Tax=Desulfospira joergensenii TaxID=53329 RepID=UPI0003B74D0A|nr:hypothetical protein [Desulfospira joergensenii]